MLLSLDALTHASEIGSVAGFNRFGVVGEVETYRLECPARRA